MTAISFVLLFEACFSEIALSAEALAYSVLLSMITVLPFEYDELLIN
ncbi:MAG: hypothetical protein Q4D76_18955 [Oscillospiraceae bacterium]|nr:hypothetical protein [Oscillospiraceae bacterium]